MFVNYLKKLNIFFYFVQIVALLLLLNPGSRIRDPRSLMGKNQDPGSGINILDPQHLFICS
jgi:hypothetical protein